MHTCYIRVLTKLKTKKENALKYPLNVLKLLEEKETLSYHKLRFERSFNKMLIKNLDTSCDHCNGARYMMVRMSRFPLYLSLLLQERAIVRNGPFNGPLYSLVTKFIDSGIRWNTVFIPCTLKHLVYSEVITKMNVNKT